MSQRSVRFLLITQYVKNNVEIWRRCRPILFKSMCNTILKTMDNLDGKLRPTCQTKSRITAVFQSAHQLRANWALIPGKTFLFLILSCRRLFKARPK